MGFMRYLCILYVFLLHIRIIENKKKWFAFFCDIGIVTHIL